MAVGWSSRASVAVSVLIWACTEIVLDTREGVCISVLGDAEVEMLAELEAQLGFVAEAVEAPVDAPVTLESSADDQVSSLFHRALNQNTNIRSLTHKGGKGGAGGGRERHRKRKRQRASESLTGRLALS